MQEVMRSQTIEESLHKLIVVFLDMSRPEELDAKIKTLAQKVSPIIPEVETILKPWFESLPCQFLTKTQLKGQDFFIGNPE